MKYKGSCHCGKVAFEVEGELNGAMSCNCSMCSRKGSLLWVVPRDQLHPLTSEENIGTYTQQVRHQAPLLTDVRHSPLRRRYRSKGQSNGRNQYSLPRRN
jgi:hypothetical protein